MNLDQACGTCHKWPEEELGSRVATIQDRTDGLLRRSEEGVLAEAIDLARQAELQARQAMPR